MSENKDISVDDDTDGEETLENVYKVSKRGRQQANCWVPSFPQNYVEKNDTVANAEDTICSDELVDKGKVSLPKDITEERNVDE